ncbi:MAG: hypothetical protein JNN06_00810 [Gemmobacter sp.]|uniref:hypothetical protein n=1 Tax=Gemmobacter sp. TaxID=1898957 RepID=UPI001A4606B8|nr:hypothetical protein [Gemmobacter sp.]MBL8560794.1 hypothetical protein [Gemmobacter sp.]
MSPEQDWPWSALGLDGPVDGKTLRRAYARRLKGINQATETESFMALRAAYEMAQRHVADVPPPAASSEQDAPGADVPPQPLPLPLQAAPPLPESAPTALGFAALANRLAPDHFAQNPAEVLEELLHSPLLLNPKVKPVLQVLARDAVRHVTLCPADGGMPRLPASFPAQAILGLDTQFGWLSDQYAYEAAFGPDMSALMAMTERLRDQGSSTESDLRLVLQAALPPLLFVIVFCATLLDLAFRAPDSIPIGVFLALIMGYCTQQAARSALPSLMTRHAWPWATVLLLARSLAPAALLWGLAAILHAALI